MDYTLNYNGIAEWLIIKLVLCIMLVGLCLPFALLWRYVWPKRRISLWFIVWPLIICFWFVGLLIAWLIVRKYKDSSFANPFPASSVSNGIEKEKSLSEQFLQDLAYVMGYSSSNVISEGVKEEAKKIFGILAYSPWYTKKPDLSKEVKKIAKCSQTDSGLFINSLIDMMNQADSYNSPRTYSAIFQHYKSALQIEKPPLEYSAIFQHYESDLQIKEPKIQETDSINIQQDKFQQALNGDPSAQCELGHCYYNGEGVEQNYTEAAKWYKLAADQGWAEAQCSLGHCYCEGAGVSQNYSEAINWFILSAGQNNPDAWYNLGYCYYEGKGVPQNYEQAFMWFLRAAAYSDVNAQLCLGDMYLAGHGVEKDVDKANEWYQKAASQS